MNKKLRYISYSYAIGAFFVVLGHSTPTGVSDMPVLIDEIRTFIYCFHMPLFFFIAGFLFKYTSDKREKPYGSFIKKKAIRFLTPYFVLSLVGIIPKVLLSSYVSDEVSFSWDYVFEAIFNPRLNVWGHFWFLPALLLIFVISYLILRCYSNKAVYSILLAVSLALAVFPINTNWFAVKDICLNLIYFCIGIAVCGIVTEKRDKIFKLPYALLSMIVAIAYYIFMTVNNFYWQSWVKKLSVVVIAIFMIYAVLCFSILLANKGCKFLDYLDGKTFSIYIISWPCQAAVEVLLNRVMHMNWYITMPAMFFAGIGVPLLFLWIYGKFKHHPKFINLIFGVN